MLCGHCSLAALRAEGWGGAPWSWMEVVLQGKGDEMCRCVNLMKQGCC